MAACGDDEPPSPLGKREIFRENETRSTSRSSSLGSFEFLVSRPYPLARNVAQDKASSAREEMVNPTISSRADDAAKQKFPLSSSFSKFTLMRMLEDEVPGAQDTIYLCNFRVSVDGEWLCLKELHDVELLQDGYHEPSTPSPVEPPFIARDPVVIERRNLVNISKLIVKELIETSLKFGRMLDSDHMPLQHFFIVLEHALRHGLRPKKGLLGPKKELWDILQVVEKLTTEAQDITSSVRDLPTVRTQMGRARAWLRLALMQKKLGDYLKLLIDHRDDILCEYFEPDALLMSDEAIVIVGLLVGLNVIDCNLCVKEEDLDCQQGVIDFSLYLRSSHHNSVVGDTPEDDLDLGNMTTVLDQKNYIEELNRHLNATVGNLQAKVESLTTTNALMKEDLAIAKKTIMFLTEENKSLKTGEKKITNSEITDEGGGSNRNKETTISTSSTNTEQLKHELELEKKRTEDVQRELNLQISLKAEMEMAMKLLEKDIHDKQDTIVSLRRQHDDIKQIKLEMYKNLQGGGSNSNKETTISTSTSNTEQLKHELELEKKRTEDVQRELNLQISLKSELEMAMMLLEKDIHDKQDTIVSLRRQLDDIKQINLEMYRKLQENESSLKHKTELISKLEAKTCAMTDTLQIMGDKQKEVERDITEAEQALKKVSATSDALREERDLRKTLENAIQIDKNRINDLQAEVNQLRTLAKNYVILQEEKYLVDEKCREQEDTLEELGRHLSDSKLKISELTEGFNQTMTESSSGFNWASDKAVVDCKSCTRDFNLRRRKHHCRHCGEIFCNSCSDNFLPIPPSTKPVRLCDQCHILILAKCTVVND